MQSTSLKVILLIVMLITLNSLALAEDARVYKYHIDLNNIVKDRFQVTLNCENFAQDTLIFHFPWMIPGTYKEANYGKFIKNLVVTDISGNKVKIKREGKSTYIIPQANKIKSISYWVGATWDSRSKKTIWPMAGTGIIENRLFAINAGGVFGYFEGRESSPVDMTYKYPDHLYAMTVLNQKKLSPGVVSISTEDYHELVDSPIMFAYPDTASFMIQDAKVLIGFAHESDDSRRASTLLEALKPSMLAIDSYLDSLPADNYAYLIYYSDEYELGKILDNPSMLALKFGWYAFKNGMPVAGALEHNKSSFYYLPDPGPGHTQRMDETVKDISIHEFMHIITPLNLRSEYVDDFDYSKPKLSKHLWLYEGITEYMSKIIQVNGGMETPKEFILGTMHGKLRSGERYPYSEVSLTEMSANVLDKENQKIYGQVYQRGAIVGMLMDIEIIRLTDGRKRLIDVLFELIDEYGQKKAMDEETLIDQLVAKVHPDLKIFFNKYVEGREALPYADILNHVGVAYVADTTLSLPKHFTKDNDVKTALLALGDYYIISKSGKDDRLGFQGNDRIDRSVYSELYFDDFGIAMPEGSVVSLPVERDGQTVFLQDTIEYIEKPQEHYMTIVSDTTPEQERYFNIWLGFEDPGSMSSDD